MSIFKNLPFSTTQTPRNSEEHEIINEFRGAATRTHTETPALVVCLKNCRYSVRSDAARRRQLIIDAGCELLIKNGQHMTLESVAERAGVGIATLYRNFSTRNDLIYHCIIQITKQQMNILTTTQQEFRAEGSDPEKKLREIIPRTIPCGINVLVPALMTAPLESLDSTLIDIREEFVTKVQEMVGTLHEMGLLHESVGLLDFLQGLIALYTPPQFDVGLDYDYPYDVSKAVDIFLVGCKNGPHFAYPM